MVFRADRPSRMSLSRASLSRPSLSMATPRTIQAVSNSPKLSRDPWARRRDAGDGLDHLVPSGLRYPELGPMIVTPSCSLMRSSDWWKPRAGRTRSMSTPCCARWALLVGTTNAAHSHPEGYADTVLTVRADSTAWATQLRYLAPRLVAMLNEQLGDGTVTLIKVLGPDAPSWKKGLRSVRDGRGPRDTYG